MIVVGNYLYVLYAYYNIRSHTESNTVDIGPWDNIYKINLSDNQHSIFAGTETVTFPNYTTYNYSGNEFLVASDSAAVENIMDTQNGNDITDCSFCHKIVDFVNDNQGNIYIFENATTNTIDSNGYTTRNDLLYDDNRTVKVLSVRKIDTSNKVYKVFNLSTSSISDNDKNKYLYSGSISRTVLHVDSNNKMYIYFNYADGNFGSGYNKVDDTNINKNMIKLFL